VSATGVVTVKNTGLTAGTYAVATTAIDVGGLSKAGTASVTVNAAVNIAGPTLSAPTVS
jgi:hypothetical protein